MNTVPIRAGMDLPSLPEGHRLNAILQARLHPTAVEATEARHAHWPAEFFGLDRANLFREASADQKADALDRCGRGLLEEAFFIEKSGVAFGAEMILLAPSIEERMLYAVFASEEARHFEAIRAFVPSPPDAPTNPFLRLLSQTIECADRTALQFLIQVVLEGWGLSHYRAIRDACIEPVLHARLDDILRDEAAHHGCGRVLFGETTEISPATASVIEEVLAAMLAMVRLGPAGVVDAIDGALGHLSRAQKLVLLVDLDARAQAQARLDHLRQLVRFDGVRSIVERLESRGLFLSLPPEDCL